MRAQSLFFTKPENTKAVNETQFPCSRSLDEAEQADTLYSVQCTLTSDVRI